MIPYVLAFGLIATAICVVAWLEERLYQVKIGLEIAPFEIAGAALGLLLILRTNAGYDRWWEARKLWGGIVNQSRNVVISALSYGPADPVWRERFVKWVAVFPTCGTMQFARGAAIAGSRCAGRAGRCGPNCGIRPHAEFRGPETGRPAS